MKKILLFLLSFVLLVSAMTFSSSALTVSDTYSDVASTSSQAVNLVNYAMSYDDFINSDFVVFCDEQYSYYIVWSDELSYDGSTVTGTDIQYIHYYRSGSSGSYSYSYQYGTDTSFGLSSSYVCTSNIDDFGFKSAVFEEYYEQYELKWFLILIGSFLFVLMISALRGK